MAKEVPPEAAGHAPEGGERARIAGGAAGDTTPHGQISIFLRSSEFGLNILARSHQASGARPYIQNCRSTSPHELFEFAAEELQASLGSLGGLGSEDGAVRKYRQGSGGVKGSQEGQDGEL